MQNCDNLKKDHLLGVCFTLTNLNDAVNYLLNYDYANKNFICFPSTSCVTKANKNEDFKKALDNAHINFIDGKYTEFIFKLKGIKKAETISGYNILESLLDSNLTHYFYGSTDNVLFNLSKIIKEKHPSANILGYKSPPFVNLEQIPNNYDIINDLHEINMLNPDVVWVSLSAPKQEVLMNNYIDHLDRGLMIGVGAVFLYYSGVVEKSPEFIKKIGMRWLYRVFREPKRFWKSTFINIYRLIELLLFKAYKRIISKINCY